MLRVQKRSWSVVLLATISFFTILCLGQSNVTAQKRVVMYFPNWGVYQAAHHNVTVGDIPWSKVTHINHAFMTVGSDNKISFTDTWADLQMKMPNATGHFNSYQIWKQSFPRVKILVSVGGWTKGNNFHNMAMTEQSRQTFADSCVQFMKKYPFIDGIDLDWEYPGVNRTKDPKDPYDLGCPGGLEGTHNFTLLLKTMRETFNQQSMKDKLLTIAVPIGYDKLDLQEPDQYHPYVDFINVMSYDMHTGGDAYSNHHSPLYGNPNDPSPESPIDARHKYNTDYGIQYLLRKGVPPEKINLGVPYYSRGWKVDPKTGTNGLFAKVTHAAVGIWDDPNSPGGQHPYFKLKELESNPNFVKYWDDTAKAPWLYNAKTGEMFTYDDEASLKEKCTYVHEQNLGGVMVWEVSGDEKNNNLTKFLYNSMY